MKLDYSLSTAEERLELVKQILEENPNPNEKYLEILADYLILSKEKKILTDNRLATINKREISYEGLVSKLENGEDGIHNLLNNNKSVLLQPKVSITKKDLEEITPLKQLKEAINIYANSEDYKIKKSLIEMRKLQYTIKDSFKKPIKAHHPQHNSGNFIKLNENIINLCNKEVCSTILCNYSILKESCCGQFNSDLWYLLTDFDEVAQIALKEEPIYSRIVQLKIDGEQNSIIQKIIQNEYNIVHSLEYISSLWRNKIPSLIASAAEDKYLYWYYTNIEKGKFKKCSRCGEIKLAHNKYFSKNKTSKDSFYSICKKCRNGG